jgi:hypothetical protein
MKDHFPERWFAFFFLVLLPAAVLSLSLLPPPAWVVWLFSTCDWCSSL